MPRPVDERRAELGRGSAPRTLPLGTLAGGDAAGGRGDRPARMRRSRTRSLGGRSFDRRSAETPMLSRAPWRLLLADARWPARGGGADRGAGRSLRPWVLAVLAIDGRGELVIGLRVLAAVVGTVVLSGRVDRGRRATSARVVLAAGRRPAAAGGASQAGSRGPGRDRRVLGVDFVRRRGLDSWGSGASEHLDPYFAAIPVLFWRACGSRRRASIWIWSARRGSARPAGRGVSALQLGLSGAARQPD